MIRINKRRIIAPVVLFAVISLFLSFTKRSPASPEQAYIKTKAMLQEAYNDEVRAHNKYLSYCDKAILEDYPNIAYLFKSLSASEGIHAKNFKKAATDLNIRIEEPRKIDFDFYDTKENLKNAVTVEIEEVDGKYPSIIKNLEEEGDKGSIQYTTFAWKSEMQHRNLIKKIQAYVGSYFKEVAKHIESNAVRYFVCQNCGSTITQIPAQTCSICAGGASGYKEINNLVY